MCASHLHTLLLPRPSPPCLCTCSLRGPPLLGRHPPRSPAHAQESNPRASVSQPEGGLVTGLSVGLAGAVRTPRCTVPGTLVALRGFFRHQMGHSSIGAPASSTPAGVGPTVRSGQCGPAALGLGPHFCHPRSRPAVVLTHPAGCESRVPTIPFSGRVSYWKGSRDTARCSPYAHQFIIKGTTQEQPTEPTRGAKYGGAASLTLWLHPSLHLCGITAPNLPLLCCFRCRGIPVGGHGERDPWTRPPVPLTPPQRELGVGPGRG